MAEPVLETWGSGEGGTRVGGPFSALEGAVGIWSKGCSTTHPIISSTTQKGPLTSLQFMSDWSLDWSRVTVPTHCFTSWKGRLEVKLEPLSHHLPNSTQGLEIFPEAPCSDPWEASASAPRPQPHPILLEVTLLRGLLGRAGAHGLLHCEAYRLRGVRVAILVKDHSKETELRLMLPSLIYLTAPHLDGSLSSPSCVPGP